MFSQPGAGRGQRVSPVWATGQDVGFKSQSMLCKSGPKKSDRGVKLSDSRAQWAGKECRGPYAWEAPASVSLGVAATSLPVCS